MYDAPDNQVVYLPCILRFMQTKPHIISSRDASCTLRNFDLFFTNDIYVRIDLLNLFLTYVGPVVATLPRIKKTTENRTHPQVCTVY